MPAVAPLFHTLATRSLSCYRSNICSDPSPRLSQYTLCDNNKNNKNKIHQAIFHIQQQASQLMDFLFPVSHPIITVVKTSSREAKRKLQKAQADEKILNQAHVSDAMMLHRLGSFQGTFLHTISRSHGDDSHTHVAAFGGTPGDRQWVVWLMECEEMFSFH